MGEVPPGHDAVRAYLDSAVAEAAERWVGRAADATAYADLVGAVLARREALSPMAQFPEQYAGDPSFALGLRPRHFERRARPRWPLPGDSGDSGDSGDIGDSGDSGDIADAQSSDGGARGPMARPPHTPVDPVQAAPFTASLEVRAGPDLPSRPPGRHRLPPPESLAPRAIDLNENLNTVLNWLGRPES
jgi:hypothetical protein